MDGGFNISATRKTRELKPSRPGFFKLIKSEAEYRTATIMASVESIQTGSYTDDELRNNLLDTLKAIGTFAMEVEDIQDPLDVSRGELIWKWSGADYTNYFEVYAVDVKLPDGVMSIETAVTHYHDRMVMRDIEITLYISPSGWGNSIHDTPTTELSLLNGSGSGTGGILVRNPGLYASAPHDLSYVETGAMGGDGRPLMKLVITPDTTYYSDWKQLMIGHVIKGSFSPYWPTGDYYDAMFCSEIANLDPTLSTVADVPNTISGWYVTGTISGPGYSPTPRISWPLGGYGASGGNPFPGNYYVCITSGTDAEDNDDLMFAAGVMDKESTYYPLGNSDIIEKGLYYSTPEVGATVVPAGVVQLPPARMLLNTVGGLEDSIRFSIWVGSNSVSSQTFSIAEVRLLPVTNGMRLWSALGSGTALDYPFYDDMMLNLYYAKNGGSGDVFLPFIPYMDSIRLHPSKGNRIYFNSWGPGSNGILADRRRGFKVQIFVTESFHTLPT
jgi:hypothetical protein